MKLLIALALALATTPATSQPRTEIVVEVDAAARAKFPNAIAGDVDAISAINRYVNRHMQYVTDDVHYGQLDKWVMAPEDAKGDCEDYAMTKYLILLQSKFPVISHTKLVTVIVHHKGKRYGHAILAVRLTTGDVMYLDNSHQVPMTRDELKKLGYEFFDWTA
jgi:predicted transglutaminase-like cysteine proteinase